MLITVLSPTVMFSTVTFTVEGTLDTLMSAVLFDAKNLSSPR